MLPIKNDYKKILLSILALVVLFFSSQMMLKGGGIGASERKAFLLASLIIILNSSRKSFWYIVIPMSLCYAIYSPIGLNFGAPSYQYIASVFSTDLMETKEFFSQIPKKYYLYPFAIVTGVLIFRFITIKNKIYFHKNKTILCTLIVFSMLNQAPLDFFKKIFHSFSEVKAELALLNNLMVKEKWGKSELVNSKYDNYILIIGESARRDYHNAYGYPINNTPFMSSSNGILVDGLTSGGTNTIASLRLMLTMPDTKKWEPDYSLNFIELAKSAGIKTYWISNQGLTGEWDTPVSSIARKSDYKYFLKYGDSFSINTSDFELLPKLNEILHTKAKEKKLIVIHLYGAHPDACERIVDYKNIIKVKDNKFSYIDCYISSIQKTDDFIKKAYSLIYKSYSKTGIKSSLVYFSDHGLAHQEVNNVIYINNSRVSKYHYNIPLFRVDTDSTTRTTCHAFKSGLNFTNGVANWIGIRNRKLSSEYDLFNCINDPSDYGLSKRLTNKSLADPAINITGK